MEKFPFEDIVTSFRGMSSDTVVLAMQTTTWRPVLVYSTSTHPRCTSCRGSDDTNSSLRTQKLKARYKVIVGVLCFPPTVKYVVCQISKVSLSHGNPCTQKLNSSFQYNQLSWRTLPVFLLNIGFKIEIVRSLVDFERYALIGVKESVTWKNWPRTSTNVRHILILLCYSYPCVTLHLTLSLFHKFVNNSFLKISQCKAIGFFALKRSNRKVQDHSFYHCLLNQMLQKGTPVVVFPRFKQLKKIRSDVLGDRKASSDAAPPVKEPYAFSFA